MLINFSQEQEGKERSWHYPQNPVCLSCPNEPVEATHTLLGNLLGNFRGSLLPLGTLNLKANDCSTTQRL